MKKFAGFFLLLTILAVPVRSQQADVTIQLNEQFFEALLDALFKNANPPEFPLGMNGRGGSDDQTAVAGTAFSAFRWAGILAGVATRPQTVQNCRETIKLQREINGTRTSVQFRDGRVVAPIAFTGDYNPPLIGCVDFAGVAETAIDLEFDANKQALIGRAKVLNVNMSGTGGVGSGFLARMVQGSIDKKINPIQILAMDKISFVVPIQNSGSLRMKASGIRPEISNGALNVRITYEFQNVD